jgi:uncharacterized tellurite resistance protein B-like protein
VLERIRDLLFGPRTAPPSEREQAERLRAATGVLLLEIAHADKEFHPMEEAVIREALQDRFGLSEGAADELVSYAAEQRKGSVDLFQFTRLINQGFTAEEKLELIEQLWRVVYADGVLHQYEDALVGKVAGLLHLSHRQLIDAKLGVIEALKAEGSRGRVPQ